MKTNGSEPRAIPAYDKYNAISNKTLFMFISFALAAYGLKFLVDAVMYIFMKNEQNDIYFDVWYLLIPQVLSSVLMIGFYALFFSDKFFGLFFKISTVVLMMANIIFAVLLFFDKTIGYIFYFALSGAVNFLNALYIKCNITPERKQGEIEYVPLIFELIPFACMVASVYSVFCAFPTLQVTLSSRVWEYYNVYGSLKVNIVCEAIMCVTYLLCMINNAEFVRDSMFIFDEEEIVEID